MDGPFCYDFFVCLLESSVLALGGNWKMISEDMVPRHLFEATCRKWMGKKRVVAFSRIAGFMGAQGFHQLMVFLGPYRVEA